jgi:hypothetical protein
MNNAINSFPTVAFDPVSPEVLFPETGEWPKPVLFGKLSTPEIPCSLLPSWLGNYAMGVSRATQTPEAMATLLSLSIIATAAHGKYEVCPHGTDYTEPLCLWTVSVLPPASRKTAVMNAFTFPLVEWERSEAIRRASEIAEAETERTIGLKRIDELLKKAAKEEDSMERAALQQEIVKLKEALPDEIKAPQLWTGDTTPEALQSLLADQKGRMALLSDEGGIFEVMAGLYSDGKVNIDVFLKGHTGSPCRVTRMGRTADIPATYLSFGLTVQPVVIEGLGSSDKKSMRGKGLLGRFLYTVPHSNIGNRDVSQNESVGQALKNDYASGVLRLLNEPTKTNIYKQPEAQKLTLGQEARKIFLAFADSVEKRMGDGKDLEPLRDWAGKLAGHALRIAGLCHLVSRESGDLEISADSMDRAVRLSTLLIAHAQAAFDLMGVERDLEDAKYLLQEIIKKKLPTVKRTELWNIPRFKRHGKLRIDPALLALEDRFIISSPLRAQTKKPTIYFAVNPNLLDCQNEE